MEVDTQVTMEAEEAAVVDIVVMIEDMMNCHHGMCVLLRLRQDQSVQRMLRSTAVRETQGGHRPRAQPVVLRRVFWVFE